MSASTWPIFHRSFGSKEKLFRAAVKAMIQPEVWLVGEPSELHMTLAQDILAEKGASRKSGLLTFSLDPFPAPKPRVFRELVDEGFVKPFASKCPLMSEQRASMVARSWPGSASFRKLLVRQPFRKAAMIVS